MQIALLGNGKMGQAISELVAQKQDDQIVLTIDETNTDQLSDLSSADVAIEFSVPSAAVSNISACLDQNIPVVSGTTGWLEKYDQVKELCDQKGGAFLYASNFSVGVNVLFAMNKVLANMMSSLEEYDVSIEEIHHTEKVDSPSGTAITLAEDIIRSLARKNKWTNSEQAEMTDLVIRSVREGKVPGTHTIQYNSPVDKLSITHEAVSRKGFASGALLAAHWIQGKSGIFAMNDVLNLNI